MARASVARSSAPSDAELMRRVGADDALAFAELYDRYGARALGVAHLMCQNPERAEEAVQDGFLAVWSSRARYDPARGSAQEWIFALIRNRSIDILRRNRRSDSLRAPQTDLDLIAAFSCTADDAAKNDEANRLRASLQQLPALQREVIVLAYFGGLSHTEIAARLALPLGTVKGRMRLGLGSVRAMATCAPAPDAVRQSTPK